MCSKWFLTICWWIFLSGFLLFTDLCKIIMEKYIGIKGDSLISSVCAPLHFCIAFWLVIYLALGLSALVIHTPETWCGQLEGDLTGRAVICCPWAFLEIKQVPFFPQGNGCTGALAGRYPGSLCQSWHVPKLSKLPFVLSPNPPPAFPLPAAQLYAHTIRFWETCT